MTDKTRAMGSSRLPSGGRRDAGRKQASGRFGLLPLLMIFILTPFPLFSQMNGEDYEARSLKVFVGQLEVPLEILKQQVAFADFVWSEDEANVTIGIKEEFSQGQRILKITFTGLKELAGKNYQTELSLPEGMEKERQQQEIAKAIKTGLVPLAGRTPAARKLKIKLEEGVKPTAVVDPWNFWVFSLSANSFLNGKKAILTRVSSATSRPTG
ncbi:MAG: hypothetical protein NUW07_00740 [Candidatus Saccharicenans sp.]|nr:hypothetical protein [Candidatus Saccharicenans sp.]